MKNFNNEQIKFIKENYESTIDDVINQHIDSDLIYYSDIEERLNQFSNIVEVLNGRYNMDNLYEDLYNDYCNENFEDIVEEVYEELDSEEQQEIDELDN